MAQVVVADRLVWYEEAGQAGAGPTVLFVHGAGGCAQVWAAQLAHFGLVGRAVAVDLPGHGRSPGPPAAGLTGYRDFVTAFIETVLPGAPVVLVGHSMGGAVAQAAALARPDLLSKVVLVATTARFHVSPRLLAALKGGGLERVWFAKAFSPATDASVLEAWWSDLVPRTAQQVLVSDFEVCVALDLRQEVGAIRLPVLVVTGQDDLWTPPQMAGALAETIPGAQLALLPDAGHFVMLEKPDALDNVMAGFLDEGSCQGAC